MTGKNTIPKFFLMLLSLIFAVSSVTAKNSITSIEFSNPKVGLLCCDNGMIFKTINTGKSWFNVSPGINEKLFRIFYISNSIVMITGANGTILRSEDAGEHWTIINANRNENLYGIFIKNTGTGFITGENKLILQTSDFGISWRVISENKPGSANDVSMCGADNGIIVGDSNFVICTTNGGISWNTPSSSFPSITSLNHVRMTDNLTAYATSSAGEVFKTTDAGAQWLLLYRDNLGLPLDKITEINKKTIAVVGDRGDMVFSFDYGSTWNSQNSGTSEKLLCMFFTDNKTGFCGGENGTLIKTIDGGYSWSGEKTINLDLPGSFSIGINNPDIILGNSPNPFNPQTIISYELAFDGAISLKVYDIAGKEIEELVNSFQRSGGYSSVFNAVNYPSGVYFYRLIANSNDGQKFSKTKRMILIK